MVSSRATFTALIAALIFSACQPTSPTGAALATATAPAASPVPTQSTRLAPLPVIFDDDGSPDGTTALFYLMADPRAEVRAVVISYGEANPKTYIQHMGRILEDLGRGGIPLGEGQGAPLQGGGGFPEWMRQSADGFWGHPIPNSEKTYEVRPAAELMVSLLNQAPEPVNILITGPCTDLARALQLDPGIKLHIEAVYIMGGAIHVPGNLSDLVPQPENDAAEWNIYADAEAARQVLLSGLELYLVPLDATNQVSVSKQDTERWRQGGRIADRAADFYDKLLVDTNSSQFAIWDVMTAQIMVEPELCEFQPLALDVITAGGKAVGQTVVIEGGAPNVNVCLQPDVDRIRGRLGEVFAAAE